MTTSDSTSIVVALGSEPSVIVILCPLSGSPVSLPEATDSLVEISEVCPAPRWTEPRAH